MANGLLDFLNTPGGIGLLSGIATYAANARRGTPVNNIGRGLAGGLAGYGQAKDDIAREQENAFNRQFKNYQLEDLRQKIEAAKAAKEWKAGLPKMMEQAKTKVTPFAADDPFNQGPEAFGEIYGGPQHGQQASGAMANIQPGNPQALQDYLMRPESPLADKIMERQLFPKDPEYKTVGDNLLKIDAEGVKPVFTAQGKVNTKRISIGGGRFQDFVVDEQMNPIRPFGEPYAKSADASSNTQTVGPTTVFSDKASEAAGRKYGTDVGEQFAAIENKYSALDSVREAKAKLDKGIYSGYWANTGMGAAKMTSGALGNRQQAARTEEFKAYIGNVVIPRLKEFGGNDSNEEMRYLQNVMGGDITMEPEALKGILDSAEVKILRGIERLQRQQKGIESGKSPDLSGGAGRNNGGWKIQKVK